MRADIDRFYDSLARLSEAQHHGRRLSDCTGRLSWPNRGVYFFFEPGEYRSSEPKVPRVVRVGTHAVSVGSKASLWDRLRAHRGGGPRGGNHRGSIFRLHVGAALLARDGQRSTTWGVGSSADRPTRMAEAEHELKVSSYIGTMSVLWLKVSDEPSVHSLRAFLERNAIALLSNGLAPRDAASSAWLGRYSPREEIRQSGLWNLNYVRDTCDPGFVDQFEGAVTATIAAVLPDQAR